MTLVTKFIFTFLYYVKIFTKLANGNISKKKYSETYRKVEVDKNGSLLKYSYRNDAELKEKLNAESGLIATMNGKGFIHNVFPKASISWSTEILLMEFKTKETDVVLFYSGDMNELVPVAQYRSTLIYIDNDGQLAYNFTRSDDHTKTIIDFKLRNKYGGVFNDNQWHFLKFIRTINKVSNGYELKISIEEDDIFIYKQLFSTQALFIKTRFLSIGGVSNRLINMKNFIGCLYKVIYKADNIQVNVLQLTQKKQHGFTEVGEQVLFTKSCQQNINDFHSISFLNSKSFVILKSRHQSYKTYNLVINFQPQTVSFLLYFHRSINNENFISVEVRDLHLVIGIGYLSQITMWYPLECVINKGNKYSFHLQLDFSSVTAKLKLNDISAERQFHSGLSDFQRDFSVFFTSEIILGGDQFTKTSIKYFPSSVWMASLRKGFKGCLNRVILNDEVFDLQRSLTSVESKNRNNLTAGCINALESQTNCMKVLQQGSPCKNNAYCESNWPNISCNCDFTNFEGYFCNEEMKPIYFDGSEFIRLDLGTEFFTEVESILIRFQTTYLFVYLFSMSPSDSSEWSASFFQLYLENGLPTFEFKPRNEKQVFQLSMNVSDGKWHSLIISRKKQTLNLNLDGKILQQVIYSNETTLSWQQLNIAASLKSIDLHYSRPFSPKIWLIKTSPDYNSHMKQNFVGKIIKFIINDVNIIDEYLLPKQAGSKFWKTQVQVKTENVNQTQLVYPITFHTHNAYLKFSKLHLYDSFSLYFHMKTNQESGVILMVSGTSNDFIHMELMQGDIRLSFNMGSNIQTIISNCDGSCNLADNKWHSIEVSRQDLSRNVLSLLIDDKIIEEITILNSHKAKNFNLDQPAFLGGLPKQEYDKWRENIYSNFGFQGCIAGFSINRKKPINLLQSPLVEIPEHFKNQIDHKCQSNITICKENHCKNGGQCIQQWQKASCDCSYTTFDGDTCATVSATIYVLRQITSYNYIRLKYQDRSRNTSRDDIAFGLQTRKQDGTIIYVESKNKDKGDFMHLYLEQGKLIFEYDMGAGIMKLTDHSIKVSDGFYRRIRVRRLGAAAWLQIDNSRSELEPKFHNHGRSFNEQTFIWIGAIIDKREAKQFEGTLSGLYFNGMKVTRVLENKSEFPFLQIHSVGEVYVNSTANIELPKNSDLVIKENKKKDFEPITSERFLCRDFKDGQCVTRSEIPTSIKYRITTQIYYYTPPAISILSTTFKYYINSSSSSLSKRSLIIIFACFSILFVVISFCVICRCYRKRGDRGSYNLTKADKYDNRSVFFDPRPDLQSSASIQSIFLEKDMIELSPLSKNAKSSDHQTSRINNDIVLNSEGSMQTIATYIPKNKIPNRKKKEIKEWYV